MCVPKVPTLNGCVLEKSKQLYKLVVLTKERRKMDEEDCEDSFFFFLFFLVAVESFSSLSCCRITTDCALLSPLSPSFCLKVEAHAGKEKATTTKMERERKKERPKRRRSSPPHKVELKKERRREIFWSCSLYSDWKQSNVFLLARLLYLDCV